MLSEQRFHDTGGDEGWLDNWKVGVLALGVPLNHGVTLGRTLGAAGLTCI